MERSQGMTDRSRERDLQGHRTKVKKNSVLALFIKVRMLVGEICDFSK